MLTHPKASLAAGGAVMVLQRTDNLVLRVRHRERTRERIARRHLCRREQDVKKSFSGGWCGIAGRELGS